LEVDVSSGRGTVSDDGALALLVRSDGAPAGLSRWVDTSRLIYGVASP